MYDYEWLMDFKTKLRIKTELNKRLKTVNKELSQMRIDLVNGCVKRRR